MYQQRHQDKSKFLFGPSPYTVNTNLRFEWQLHQEGSIKNVCTTLSGRGLEELMNK